MGAVVSESLALRAAMAASRKDIHHWTADRYADTWTSIIEANMRKRKQKNRLSETRRKAARRHGCPGVPSARSRRFVERVKQARYPACYRWMSRILDQSSHCQGTRARSDIHPKENDDDRQWECAKKIEKKVEHRILFVMSAQRHQLTNYQPQDRRP